MAQTNKKGRNDGMVKPWVAQQQGLIQTPNDLLNLHLIDFRRLNGY